MNDPAPIGEGARSHECIDGKRDAFIGELQGGDLGATNAINPWQLRSSSCPWMEMFRFHTKPDNFVINTNTAMPTHLRYGHLESMSLPTDFWTGCVQVFLPPTDENFGLLSSIFND